MKIYYLMPGKYGPDYCTDKATYLTPYISPGTNLQVFSTGDTATLSISSVVDMALIGPATVARVIEAEKTGFDGVILGATWDFSIEAARGAVTIPVVGAGAATYHMAAQLADAFGVVVHDDTLIPEFLRRIRLMGCVDRITSMRSFDIPIPQFRDRKEEVEEKFVKTARRQLDEEGAQLIVEGCMGIFSNLGTGARERIEKTLGVPVLEPGAVAVKTAEMLISLKITHSKKTYPSPPEK